MASPQPECFLKYSKELILAKMKVRIGGVQNQVFEAIMYMTYGQYPPVKMTKYSNKQIMALTGLSSVGVAKAKTALAAMKMIFITNNGNKYVEMVGINKDYDSWTLLPKKVTGRKVLPKKVTNVTKNGNALIIKKERKNSKQSQIFHFQKAVPVPQNLYLTDDMIAYAKEKKIIGGEKVFNEIFESMKDWHLHSGKKRNDWHATWRTWIRNHIKFYPDSVEKEKIWADI